MMRYRISVLAGSATFAIGALFLAWLVAWPPPTTVAEAALVARRLEPWWLWYPWVVWYEALSLSILALRIGSPQPGQRAGWLLRCGAWLSLANPLLVPATIFLQASLRG